ncbi:MAG: DUF805 domain-containing protein [Alphaproteobacteria bacterium]|nr:DUF805 domain-containing protein [Alphaproteobacteria bacterium]
MDFNKLWQNFMDMVQNHYMDFGGRMNRAKFWYFMLVCFGVLLAASIIDAIVTYGLLRAIVGLALLLPIGGAAARRMQDTGRSGQLGWIWILIGALYDVVVLLMALSGPWGVLAFFGLWPLLSLAGLAMLVVTILIIYFCAQPGEAGPNAYGPPPAPWSPN